MALGITDYACRLPLRRLPADALAGAGVAVPSGLRALRVADVDEDALTLALAAASAIASEPGMLALASTSLPYRRRVQVGLLGRALGLDRRLLTLECVTSGRAGTEALVAAAHAVLARGAGDETGFRALLVAAEVPRRGAGTAADVAGAGAVALELGQGGSVATIEAFGSYAAEDPGLDFVRAGEEARRDVQVPDYAVAAYVDAVRGAAAPVLERLGRDIDEYDFVALDHPSPRLVAKAARALGLQGRQWQAARAFPETGDTGAAGALLETVAALDAAEPGDRILVVGHGSGSAADAVSLEAGPDAGRGELAAALARASAIDYVTYLKLRGAV